MLVIEVKKNQSLLDISLQEYGDITFVFQLIGDNPKLQGITDNVYEGDTLNITENIGNTRVRDFLRAEDIATLDETVRASGIGFWEIEQSFIIQ